jgi:hypothetical protein
MSKKTIFLAGPLRGMSFKDVADWRQYVGSKLPDDVIAFSALRGKPYLVNANILEAEYPEHLLSTPQGTITRDRYDVFRCDALFVNFLNSTTVSIGTIMEMAWADSQRTPVILVMEKGNIHDHPFVRQLAAYITADLDEAIQTAINVVTMRDTVVANSSSAREGSLVTREKALPASIDDLKALVHTQEEFIFSHAREHEIDPLTLRSQLLLHLPRLVTDDYFPNEHDVRKETIAVTAFIEKNQHPYAHWLKPPEQPIELSDLEFVPLDANIAKIYHERFHYAGSYRPGRHFAFRDKKSGRIVCMGSVANFDLIQAKEKIAPHISPESALVYSRFFAYRWSPKNTFSHFHKKLHHQLVKESDTQLMFSFINPNLGFGGSSHIAAQWEVFALEEGTRYMYLDNRYRTMRYFVENYGLNDPEKLKEKLGDSFKISTVNLHPLLLLANPLQRRARKVIPTLPYLFQRPILENKQVNVSRTTQEKRRNIDRQLLQVTEKYINFVGKAHETEKDNIRGIADVFSNMDKGDIFVYVSGTTDPFEVRPEKNELLRPVIADALARGATFLYVRPTEKYLKDLGQPLHIDLAGEFDEFTAKILSHLPSAHASFCQDRLRLIQTDKMSHFDVAGSKWDMFISDKIKAPNGLQGRGLIPAGGIHGDKDLHFFQSHEMAKILIKEVVNTIHETNSLNDDLIPYDVVSRLDSCISATQRSAAV